MELGLAGRIIIVTGGASGIGAAVVDQLASHGAIPIIFDKAEPDAAMLDRLRARAPAAAWLTLDLCDDDQCVAAVADIVDRHGKIDGLVNNAGVNDAVGIDAGPAAFRRSLDRNLVHYYTMAHLCIPALKRQRGAIVNVSSKLVFTGQSGTSAYAAAKGGVLSLTREWAAELAKDGVRVNAVVPGETMTPMYDAWLSGFENPQAKLEGIVRNVPLGTRMTQPAEIAAPIVFLLSDWASHATGQWLVVDGGYTHLDRALTTPVAE